MKTATKSTPLKIYEVTVYRTLTIEQSATFPVRATCQDDITLHSIKKLVYEGYDIDWEEDLREGEWGDDLDVEQVGDKFADDHYGVKQLPLIPPKRVRPGYAREGKFS
jgi:hypothetical protein